MENQLAKFETAQLSKPEDILRVANILKEFIKKNKLSCQIQGKEYAFVDGWKFAGQNFGLTAIPNKPINESKEGEIKYSCDVEIIQISTGMKMGYGFAICSNKESKKKNFDEYAIASMAQTRAIGKAFRNLLGYIMNAAGFEVTPAEEMEERQYHDFITDDQLAYIDNLIHTSTISEKQKVTIEREMYEYTKERAEKCISFLKDNQKETLDQEFDRAVKKDN